MSNLFSFSYAFNDFSTFIAMGKHGLYVWLSYFVFTLAIVGLWLNAFIKSKRLKTQLQDLK